MAVKNVPFYYESYMAFIASLHASFMVALRFAPLFVFISNHWMISRSVFAFKSSVIRWMFFLR